MSEDTPDPTADPYAAKGNALTSAYNLATRLGKVGLAKQIQKRIGKFSANHGLDSSGFQGEDFGASNFSMTDANAALPYLNQARRAQGGTNMRPGAFGSKVNLLQQENVDRTNRAAWEGPGGGKDEFASLREQGAQMVRDPTFSADYLAYARSKIANTIRTNLDGQLRSTNANFGGQVGGPAQTALAAHLSQHATGEIASRLSDFGLNVADMEKGDKARDIAFQADLIGRETALNAGVRDPAFLFQLNDSLHGLMEALRVQKEAQEYERDLQREASSRDWFTMAVNGAAQVGSAAAGAGAFGGGGGMGGASSTARGYTPPLGTSYNDSRTSLRL